jgi:hypothetical protein
MCNPAQPLAGGMRIHWVGIGRANDFGQKLKRRITQAVLLQDGIERDIFTMVSQLAVRDIVNNAVADCGQSVATGKKTNSASWSMKVLMSQGQATRSTFTCSRVIHFMRFL